MTRGEAINRRAAWASEVIRLERALADLEKQARRTPRGDMPDEVAKVFLARGSLWRCRADLARAKELRDAAAAIERHGGI